MKHKQLRELETHSLKNLIGKTIIDVEAFHWDVYDNGENIREVIKLSFANVNDNPVYLLSDGGCTSQYATISIKTKQELKENIGANDDSEEEND